MARCSSVNGVGGICRAGHWIDFMRNLRERCRTRAVHGDKWSGSSRHAIRKRNSMRASSRGWKQFIFD
jgi:hypothetical protein